MPNQDIHEAVLEFEDPAQDALYPLRSKMRPTDAEGVREAWTIVELLWSEWGRQRESRADLDPYSSGANAVVRPRGRSQCRWTRCDSSVVDVFSR